MKISFKYVHFFSMTHGQLSVGLKEILNTAAENFLTILIFFCTVD